MIIDEVKELGFMDNGTGKHQSNTVVDENGLAPTVTTVNGGGTQQIKVLTENIPCTTSRVVNGKFADVDDLSLININKTESGAVVSRYYKGIEGDHSDAVIVAMRGRNPENPSDRTVGAPTEQRLEPNSQGICNTLTSVTKDNLVMEKKCISTKGKENDVASTILSGYERPNMTGFNADNGVLENVNTQYRIRKLTPRECYRLMAVPEESIDKMLEVNSNTQCYKQAGNSIVVNCLIAIFSQMGIQGIPRWNDGLCDKYK